MSDVETDTASDTSWRENSDDDFVKKFEREDQMEEILQCYQTGGINTDDNFIYCDLCNRRWCRSCPQHGRLKHVRDKKVPTGIEGRARKTAPRFLSILPSKIKGAKNGVWTSKSIPKRTYFGPFEGCEVPLDHANRDYCWKVMKDGKPKCLVDGSDPTRSNWMRYVNCARTAEEQNLEAFQFKGAIFYRTTKDIDAKQELLVWYGFKFARKLGIKWKDFVVSNLPDKRDFAESTLEREPVSSLSNEDSLICMEVTTGDMPITCGVCGARFRRRGRPLQYHLKSHSDRKHNCCLKCGQWFPDEAALNEHRIAASQTLKDFPDSGPNVKRQGGVICDTKSSKIRSKPVQNVPVPECTENRRSTRGTSGCGMNEDRPVSHPGNVEGPSISHTEVNEDRLTSNAGASNDQLISNTGENDDHLVSPDESTENKSGDQVKGIGGPVLRRCKDVLLCDKCGAMFLRTSLLVSHLETQHGIQSKEKELFAKTCQPKRFRCKECGILYRKKETLEQHLKLHEDTSENEVSADAGDEKKFACNKCEMKFRAEITLKFHMEVHREKNKISAVLFQPTKKFKCKECHVRFRAKSTLRLHMKTHDEEKRYPNKWGPNLRSRSNQTFFTGSIFKQTLKKDERAELPKTQADFLSGGGLSGVGIVHDGKRNSLQQGRPNVPKRKDRHPGGVPTKRPRRTLCLECLACGFIFKDRAGLDAHVRKHTEEKMLVCDLSSVRVAV